MAPATRSRKRSWTRTTGGEALASIVESLAGGTSGSSGRYAPPAVTMPSSATTISTDRSRHTATGTSRPTPRDLRNRASRFTRPASSA